MQMRKEISPPRRNSGSDDSEDAMGRTGGKKRTFKNTDDEDWIDTPKRRSSRPVNTIERRPVKQPPVHVTPVHVKAVKPQPKQISMPAKQHDEHEFDVELHDRRKAQNRFNKLQVNVVDASKTGFSFIFMLV